jgi:Protein of unknown function (DUF3016)
MYFSAHRNLCRAFVATALLASACAMPSSDPEQASRVSVTFVEPEKFTDAKRSEMERSSAGLLAELHRFMVTTAERYIPTERRLYINILDVDLAGDFELFRGPDFDRVRITKGLYPPRIVLEFRLTDGGGRTIKEGKRELTDIDYQVRSAYPREDYLRYEKDILSDWLRDEFGSNAGKMSRLRGDKRG